ncbi:MAG TPA: bifunctional riboflavin kinase/FAD synthetase [Xanthomonadaceae bacterium]|jgi:riboflavin kinase/FMN adenylyltransferase
MNRLFRDVEGAPLCPNGSVVCIGAFDGLHPGHRALVGRAVARARELGVEAVVLSFEPLPREFFAITGKPARLSPPRMKVEGLFALGADRIGLLRFDAALARTGAREFVERVLVQRLAAREVWVGPGFRFGKGREGDVSLLGELGATMGFQTRVIEPCLVGGERASSSRIRALLGEGDLATAARWLGRPYAIAGRVVRGRQLGRKLGFPTANLRFAGLTPALGGVFATRVRGAGFDAWPSVSSLGTRPTVDGVEPLLEAHLFDFDGDLYGKRIEVEFVAKLRDEARFQNLDALIAQMDRDAEQARAILGAPQQRRGAMA